MKRQIIKLATLAVAFSACKRIHVSNSSVESPKALVKVIACDLVTIEDIAAIQGAKMVDAHPSEGPTGDFLTTQCYYSSAEPNKSVNIAVIQRRPGPGPHSDPANYWHEKFVEQPAESEHAGNARERDEEGEKRPELKKIDGLGDDAYWQGGSIGGVLYVLKGNVLLRISVGGAGNEQEMRDKSEELARKALNRL